MTGQYTDTSNEHDFAWQITREDFSYDREAQITIGGYKYPGQDFPDRPKHSQISMHCDLVIGERFSHHQNLDFGGNSETGEDILADLDKTIDMLQQARVKFAELMIEFPSQSWRPDNG